MRVGVSGWFVLLLLVWTASSFADSAEIIPAKFPVDQLPAFTQERLVLLAEGKKLDTRLVRHNKTCSAPDPYHAQKCSQDRLVLYKQLDDYQKKVKDFNRRLAAVDANAGKKPQTGE